MTIHSEGHLSHRGGWLRAAVLGANDGILSTAGLVLGVAAGGRLHERHRHGRGRRASSPAACRWRRASSSRSARSATSRSPTSPGAPRARAGSRGGAARAGRRSTPERGLSPALAQQVAEELYGRRPPGGPRPRRARHRRGDALARPLQAAWSSAVSFSLGAVVPLLAITLMPTGVRRRRRPSLITLARPRRARGRRRPAGRRADAARGARVSCWGAVAMALTSAIGALVGTAV